MKTKLLIPLLPVSLALTEGQARSQQEPAEMFLGEFRVESASVVFPFAEEKTDKVQHTGQSGTRPRSLRF